MKTKSSRKIRSVEPPCLPPAYELACRMLNAIGWNGNDFRLRDPIVMAIASEVERINKKATEDFTSKNAHENN